MRYDRWGRGSERGSMPGGRELACLAGEAACPVGGRQHVWWERQQGAARDGHVAVVAMRVVGEAAVGAAVGGHGHGEGPRKRLGTASACGHIHNNIQLHKCTPQTTTMLRGLGIRRSVKLPMIRSLSADLHVKIDNAISGCGRSLQRDRRLPSATPSTEEIVHQIESDLMDGAAHACSKALT